MSSVNMVFCLIYVFFLEIMSGCLAEIVDKTIKGTDYFMECVCYGLGNFSSCVSARYQLAMLLLLLDALQVNLLLRLYTKCIKN